MVKEMKTRDFLKILRKAGWTSSGESVGSHTKWYCPTGNHMAVVVDGHRTISPGVIRDVTKRMAACDCDDDPTNDDKEADQ